MGQQLRCPIFYKDNIMKQLNEIPQLQSKRRVIKRHVIHDFKSHQRKIFWQDLIFSCIIFAMLIATVILFTFDIDTSLHW